MKKSNKATTRKIAIITLMLLVVCLYFVAGTYARYAWKGTATGTAAVAKWQVGFGDTQETTTSVEFTVNENQDVATGKIAPGCTATGEFKLNPDGSEVSIDYKFKIDETKLPDGVTMKVSNVTIDGEEITRAEGETWYTKTISLNGRENLTAADACTVVVSVTWFDDGIALESNSADGYGTNKDTLEGIKADTQRKITLPVTVVMEQHV